MATYIADIIDAEIQYAEESGRIRRVVRPGMVTGLTSTGAAALGSEVRAVLPAVGSTITIDGQTLTLKNREWSRPSGEKNKCNVTLTYEATTGASGTDVINRGVRTGLRQLRRVTDRDNQKITVTYQGESRPGDVTVLVPEIEPWYEILEETNTPEAIALQWSGHVNSSSWNGEAAGKWLCRVEDVTAVDFTSSPQKWLFRYAFQLADGPEGWLPLVAYVDPNTNQVPADATIGDGIATVPYYPTRDFNAKF